MHCTENDIFFFQTSWKDGFFQKKLRWNMIFLVLSGNIMFLFMEKMILRPRRKMKDYLSQKKYTEIWHFRQISWREGLFKKSHIGTWSFLLSEKVVFFSPKTWYFFCGHEMRDDLAQEIHGNIIFFVYTYGC